MRRGGRARRGRSRRSVGAAADAADGRPPIGGARTRDAWKRGDGELRPDWMAARPSIFPAAVSPAARAPQQHQVVDGAPATATRRRHAALHLGLRRHLDGATAPDLVSMAQLAGIVGGGGELAGALHTSTATGKSIAAMEIPQARPPRRTFSFPPNFLVAPPPAAARDAPQLAAQQLRRAGAGRCRSRA